MSGESVARLKRRARAFLSEAEEARDADLAVFFAEQAMQLCIKAIYFDIFGGGLRGHGLRELLGVLVRALEAHGYDVHAGKLLDFIDKHRRQLMLVEEAYIMSRYGDVEYSREDAVNSVSLARELTELLEGVSRSVKLG